MLGIKYSDVVEVHNQKNNIVENCRNVAMSVQICEVILWEGKVDETLDWEINWVYAWNQIFRCGRGAQSEEQHCRKL